MLNPQIMQLQQECIVGLAWSRAVDNDLNIGVLVDLKIIGWAQRMLNRLPIEKESRALFKNGIPGVCWSPCYRSAPDLGQFHE